MEQNKNRNATTVKKHGHIIWTVNSVTDNISSNKSHKSSLKCCRKHTTAQIKTKTLGFFLARKQNTEVFFFVRF